MPNVMSVLRAEIRRLARKETKEAVRDLKRQVAAMRRRMAAAKREMGDLERLARRGAAPTSQAAAAGGDESGQQIRFSPRWVRVHRAKLKMSRKAYARLVGVSPQTILLWESGKTRPRRGVLAAWRALREKGIRELKAALGGDGPAAPKRGARKGTTRAGRRPRARAAAKRTRGARAKKK
ncbi:MAG TPA: helix-turn-helix domain-containing protein [Candidatus Eisenbacteria bacterium]